MPNPHFPPSLKPDFLFGSVRILLEEVDTPVRRTYPDAHLSHLCVHVRNTPLEEIESVYARLWFRAEKDNTLPGRTILFLLLNPTPGRNFRVLEFVAEPAEREKPIGLDKAVYYRPGQKEPLKRYFNDTYAVRIHGQHPPVVERWQRHLTFSTA